MNNKSKSANGRFVSEYTTEEETSRLVVSLAVKISYANDTK